MPKTPLIVERVPPPAPRYQVEGPLEERQEVETPWGKAWAEPGCYVLKDVESGELHIVHPDDFELQYRPV